MTSSFFSNELQNKFCGGYWHKIHKQIGRCNPYITTVENTKPKNTKYINNISLIQKLQDKKLAVLYFELEGLFNYIVFKNNFSILSVNLKMKLISSIFFIPLWNFKVTKEKTMNLTMKKEVIKWILSKTTNHLCLYCSAGKKITGLIMRTLIYPYYSFSCCCWSFFIIYLFNQAPIVFLFYKIQNLTYMYKHFSCNNSIKGCQIFRVDTCISYHDAYYLFRYWSSSLSLYFRYTNKYGIMYCQCNTNISVLC